MLKFGFSEKGLGLVSPPDFGYSINWPNFIAWLSFLLNTVVLRVSRRKTPKCFPAESFFLAFLAKCLSKCSSSTNLLPICPAKFLAGHLHPGIIPCKILHHKVWQCSECVCLDNCSVIRTVTSCYVLHETHSEFWHIQHSVFSGRHQ